MHPVSLSDELLDNPKAIEAIRNAALTGKPFGVLSFGVGDAKRHLQSVMVDGRPPISADEWAHVNRFVNLHAQVHTFCIRWNGVTELLSVPPLNGGVAGLRQIEVVAISHERRTGLPCIMILCLQNRLWKSSRRCRENSLVALVLNLKLYDSGSFKS